MHISEGEKTERERPPTQSIGKRGNSWPNRENWGAEWVTSKMVTHDNNQHRMYDIIHTHVNHKVLQHPFPVFNWQKVHESFFTWSTVLDLQFFKGKAFSVGLLKSANYPRLMIFSPSIQACDEPCLHQQRENYHMKPNIWPMLENRSLQMQGPAQGVFVLRVHYDWRWRKKKEEYQRKKKLVEFFFVFIGHLIQLQTHWFHDQILPLTIAILHHHSCCLGNSLLSLQRHHRYHQLLPTLLQHLA